MSLNACIEYNCQPGGCASEAANRALFHACLKAENIFMPYQCANYIKAYAENQTATAQAYAMAQQKELAAIQAQQEQIKAEAAAKAKQIEAEAALALQQQQFQLEEQRKLAELQRQTQEEEAKRLSQPNVKYTTLLNSIKNSLTSAKNYSNQAYNILGITKSKTGQATGNIMYFPPQIISIDAIQTGGDARSLSIKNNSKYKDYANFVCTKNTRESVIKSELINVYNIISNAKNAITNGISEIETLNIDSPAGTSVSDEQISTLYQVQNKLISVLNTITEHTEKLKTNCETRCEGIETGSMSLGSNAIEFDANGMIVTNSSSNGNYSCQDLNSNTMDITNMFTPTGTATSPTDMMGGIGKQVSDLTKRVTEAVLNIDKLIEETELAVTTGNFNTGFGSTYAQANACLAQVANTSNYASCLQTTLGSQFVSYSQNADYSALQATMQTANTFISQQQQGTTACELTQVNFSSLQSAQECFTKISKALGDISGGGSGGMNSNDKITDVSATAIMMSGRQFSISEFTTQANWKGGTNYQIINATGNNQNDRLNNARISCTKNSHTYYRTISEFNNGSRVDPCR